MAPAPAIALALLAAVLGRVGAQQCLVASTFLGLESTIPRDAGGLAIDASGITWMADIS